MSSEQHIFVIIVLMIIGFLLRSLPQTAKDVALAIGGLGAILGIILIIIGEVSSINILTMIGIYLVAPTFAAFVGSALLENAENAWDIGRSTNANAPRKQDKKVVTTVRYVKDNKIETDKVSQESEGGKN